MKKSLKENTKQLLQHLLAINILLLVIFVLLLIPFPSRFGYIYEPCLSIDGVKENVGIFIAIWIAANAVLFIMSKDKKSKN